MEQNNLSSKGKNTRELYFDVLRIISCVMVIFVHTSAVLVIDFPETDGIVWKYINAFNGLGRAAVPLFIMISGALLLDENKKIDIKKFYSKTIVSFLLILFGWMIAYGTFYAVIIPDNESSTFLSRFTGFLLKFENCRCPHLWYMFMLIGMYFTIPLFRFFVKKENKNLVLLVIAVSFFIHYLANTLNIIPAYFGSNYLITDFTEKFFFTPIGSFVCPLLAGWYLSTFELKKKTRICFYVLGIISLSISILCVQFLIDKIPQVRSYVYEHFSAVALIEAAALFIFIKSIFENKTSSKGVLLVSNLTMGIYLVHVVFIELFFRYIWIYAPEEIHPVAYWLLFTTFVLIFSFLTSFVISKIKYVRKSIYLK